MESDLPFSENTFLPKFESFRIQEPDEASIVLRHHYNLPKVHLGDLGRPVYRQAPWAIYHRDGEWFYFGIVPGADETTPFMVGIFSEDHCRGDIYHPDPALIARGGWASLTGFPSDQMVLSHAFAHHQACYVHSSGLIIKDQGLLFVGRSGAGKSTLMKMVLDRGQVLCDDCNIVRYQEGKFWAHGSWSHGELPIVSNARAPLRRILFLQQAANNRLQMIADRREVVRLMLASLMRPYETKKWWELSLELIEGIAREVPAAWLHFDKSGRVAGLLEEITN